MVTIGMKTTERNKFRRYWTVFFFFKLIGIAHSVEVDLTPRHHRGTTVKVVMEVQGTLDVNSASNGKKLDNENTLPMKGVAELSYGEQVGQGEIASKSLRRYTEAVARIEVSKRTSERRLRDGLNIIQCELDTSKPLLYSPHGALDRNELELLTVPFNSLFVDQLLPQKRITLGDQWSHQNDVLTKLLDVDAITAGDVTSRVTAIEKDLVRIELKGSIVGSVDGVVTDLDVEAKYNFDRKLRRITWLAAKIKEHRSIGLTAPGFDVLARVRMAIAPSNSPNLANLVGASQDKADAILLEHRARDNRFSFLHDRRWHIINEAPNRSVLRMIDDGETIAQCNIRMMKVDPKKQTTLEHFKKEILRGLKHTQPQIADATALTNAAGLAILRVQVLGTVSQSPVQWIYYHAANKEGSGLTYSFTMSADSAAKFQATDHAITSSLRISNTALQSSIRSALAR